MTSTIADPAGTTAPPSASLPVAAWSRDCYIYDEDGRDYLDGSSGPIAVNLGHAVPEVLDAMRQQAGRLVFAYRTQFTSGPLSELTDEVLAVAGPEFREVVYTNSGSEATEVALRTVFHHHAANGEPHRTAVLMQTPSYHGMTAGALAASGHPGRRANLGALHDHSATTVPVTSTQPDQLLPGIAEWKAAFEAVGPRQVAAVILEPVGGAAGGAAVVDDDVLRGLAALCRDHGALLILDEVMTGFGRTGRWFGHRWSGITPDLVIAGKGLSAGYTPIGACLIGRDVLPRRTVTDLTFGHTMSGNPLSSAVALEVLRYTRRHDLPARAERIGALLRARLADLADAFEFVAAPRGRGLLLALPVLQDKAGFARAPLSGLICRTAQRHGLILYPAGVDQRSQAVLVAPPLTTPTADIHVLIERLHATLRAVADQIGQE
jgi:adenosylmethionine-8-amino-7-oxononanoate aminotransferase